MNIAMLTGRLVNDPTLRHTTAGSPVTNITIQTQATHRDQFGILLRSEPWIKVVVYNDLALECTSTLRRGVLVYVEGSLHTHKWRDPQGLVQYVTEIEALRIQPLESILPETPDTEEAAQAAPEPTSAVPDPADPVDADGTHGDVAGDRS
ncbi:MAG: single-stranded DNA-binding protein [Desulfovibrio sp.]|jgi:single-strand DNA-binding protein|nr:single-stranded DNA-binding protein [Desulfovibrio sp.]